MVEKFSMTYEQVEDTVAQLTRFADAIKDELDNVTRESNRVTQADWEGKSAASYKSTFNSLRPRFDLFYSQIVECVNYLNIAMGKNQSTDTKVSATFAEK